MHSSWALDCRPMRIAKPMLLITTPIGLVFGIYEGYRLAGGLVFLMIALISLIGVAMGTVVATVRRERREEEAARAREISATAEGESK
jgi:hypothetical protein